MKKLSLKHAMGEILAHDITEVNPQQGCKGVAFRRGHVIQARDLEVLRNLGKRHIYVWEGSEPEVHEDDAARILAPPIAGQNIRYDAEPREGKVGFYATCARIFKVDVEHLERINALSIPSLPTIHTNFPVREGKQVAAFRIIPLSCTAEMLARIEAELKRPPTQIKPYVCGKTTLLKMLSGRCSPDWAFASRPALLLLDEPFSALDQGVREEMRDILITLVDEFQTPALLVTHDREEACVFGEHMVVMHDGRVLESGVLEQIYHAPVCLETARMLGFDNAWWIAGYEESQVMLENGWKVKSAENSRTDATHLCIRPEDVMILRPDRPLRHRVRDNVISVILRRIHPRGRHYKLVVEASSKQYLDIDIPAHAFRVMGLQQGQTLNISLKSHGLVGCRNNPYLHSEEI